MMKEARMFVFALAVMLTMTACGATEPEANDGVDDTPERSDADYLAEASDKDSKDGKADSPAPCGQEMCDRVLCGYDCTTSGTQCERACSSTDARADSYVLFNVSGTEDARLDSRDLAYVPKLSLKRVLLYGCELWDYSDGSRDALEVKYKKIYNGAFAVGQPESIGDDAYIFIETFEGPGSYLASGKYSRNTNASKAKDYYWDSETCGVEIDVLDNGGIRGEFVCGAIPNRSNNSSVRMVGEFECGVNAMDLEFIDLEP